MSAVFLRTASPIEAVKMKISSRFRIRNQPEAQFFCIRKRSNLVPPSCAISSAASMASKGGFLGWYLEMLNSKPIFTKSLTSALIYTVADLSAQYVNSEPIVTKSLTFALIYTVADLHAQTIVGQSPKSYDFVRTSRMAGYGLLILGPILHYWFTFMSSLFPRQNVVSTLMKMFLGETVYGPAIIVIFFSLMACMQGENSAEIAARLKRDFFPTWLNGVMYWLICDFITFKFIPVHLQPLGNNVFSYVWTIYMTYMASREKAVLAAS